MSTRQNIIDAFKTRMQGIKTASGYNSNVGANVKEWVDLDTSPIAYEDLPALVFMDPNVNIYTEVIGKWTHYMTIHISIFCTHRTDVAKECRNILADVIAAVGTDRSWSGYADTTDFEGSPGQKHLNMQISINERNIARADFRLVISYKTSYWVT